ncbi:prolipoprotein diacylglyceryl transferase [Porcipelethomonas ammoniilytica]|uniref:prolipoprotein diacylglyceryl transferase n=1 Tax=Porcipelethomonas ammoniilytica TaxID=2981722 RepID=UPI0008231F16|nr:prolipoprotein diacylglyceryl transferase family protein [Porcipelethomonas ammoniilytica]MCU6720223.1 prolipoprotein diacylglyceryl transferase [Porcipelethomonas ammoniilytica]SCJ05964.1 Prolipoprotein diacylglyceryl transferase [uncultured Ruminococcus sp.]
MFPLVNITIPSYVFFSTLGAISAIILLFFRMERFDITFKQLLLYMFVSVITLLIGSRLLFFLTMIPEIIRDFSVNKMLYYMFNGGIVFYGGLLGMLFGIWLCTKIKHDDKGKLFNFVAPAIPLFHFWGRIGCFFGGCCYGVENSWGFSMAASPEVIRFPVQLFESFFNLLIFISLMIISEKFKSQRLIIIYLIEYSCCRFVLEFFRGDSVRGIWGVLSTSQIISLIILFFCIIHIIKFTKRKKPIG